MDSSIKLISIKSHAPRVRIVYTTKVGGFSKQEYEGLNLGLHVGDDCETVIKNRVLLEKTLNHPLVFMNQTHSSEVLLVGDKDCFNPKLTEKEPNFLGVEADGIVAFNSKLALAVMTADCLPLILYTADGVIAAIHCGWKGIYKGIIDNAVNVMKALSFSQIHAAIGPCIAEQSYEVGFELKEKFQEKFDDVDFAFSKKENGKYLCSLEKLVEKNLQMLEISSIEKCGQDTLTNGDLYSYRRNLKTGRMATIVYIE